MYVLEAKQGIVMYKNRVNRCYTIVTLSHLLYISIYIYIAKQLSSACNINGLYINNTTHLFLAFISMVTKKCVICKGKSHAYWPKNPDQVNKWVRAMDDSLPNLVIKKSHGLCAKHFKPSDFSNWISYHCSDKRDQSSR